MSNFDSMGKEELRAACRKAGISYGKLNNDGMRAALKTETVEMQKVLTDTEAKPAVKVTPADMGIGPVRGDGRPAPLPAVASTVAPQPVVEAGPRQLVTGKVVKPKSLKIEKDRESQNGVTKPSAGSICRAIWDALDAKVAKAVEAAEGDDEDSEADEETQTVPSFEDLRELMKQHGWSKNTAMTQYQRWKQFHGVMPRSKDE